LIEREIFFVRASRLPLYDIRRGTVESFDGLAAQKKLSQKKLILHEACFRSWVRGLTPPPRVNTCLEALEGLEWIW